MTGGLAAAIVEHKPMPNRGRRRAIEGRGARSLRAGPLVAALTVVLASCLADHARDELEDESAAVLLAEVRGSDYRSWAAAPELGPTPVPARGPHGARVAVFLSPDLERAATTVPGSEEDELVAWPPGAIAVSEGYGPEGEAPLLLMVAKRGERTWTWAQYDEDDGVLAMGQPGSCIGCHHAGQDYLFSVAFAVAPQE